MILISKSWARYSEFAWHQKYRHITKFTHFFIFQNLIYFFCWFHKISRLFIFISANRSAWLTVDTLNSPTVDVYSAFVPLSAQGKFRFAYILEFVHTVFENALLKFNVLQSFCEAILLWVKDFLFKIYSLYSLWAFHYPSEVFNDSSESDRVFRNKREVLVIYLISFAFPKTRGNF